MSGEAEEAEEVFEEVKAELTTITKTMSEEIQVVSEAAQVTDDTVNISEEVNTAMKNVQEGTFTDLLQDEGGLRASIDTEVDGATSEIEAVVRNVGVNNEEIGAEIGNMFARSTAEQRAVADATQSSMGLWERLKQIGGIGKKIVEAYIVIDFVGRIIGQIVSAISDAEKTPTWKGSLTEEQKEQLKRLQDAIQTLRPVLESWETALEPLEKNKAFSYGTMKVTSGEKELVIQVIDVVAHLIQDTIIQLTQAKGMLTNGIDGLSVFDLTQLSNYIFAGFANAQAIINLRDNTDSVVTDDKLALYKFPPKDDDIEVKKVLEKNFPQWKEMVKGQASTLAKMGAKMAIGAFTQSQVILKVNSYLRDQIYPQIKDAAKDAGVKSATNYIDGHRATIIEKALIPIVGPEQAREYGKELQKEALKVAQVAAQKAGKAKANQLTQTIEDALKPIVDDVVKTNKDNMTEIGQYAAKQILNTVNPPDESKPDCNN